MSDSIPPVRPLSEKPAGYLLAVAGGLLGAPLGLIVSPGILFLLGKAMRAKDGKRPNRFAVWALIGIIGAPVCLAIGNSEFRRGLNEGASQTNSPQTENSAIQPRSEDTSARSRDTEIREEPRKKDLELQKAVISVGDFTISNVRIEPYNGEVGNADVAGELWAVYADVRNDSKETKVPGYSMTTELMDSEQRTFKSADFVVTSNSIVNESFGGEKVIRFSDGILPGSTRQNVQVGIFDVSKGASGLRFCAGALFSGTKCIGG